MKKRILSIILALLMVFSVMISPASAAGLADTLEDIDYTELLIQLLNSGDVNELFTSFGQYIAGLIGGDLVVSDPGDAIVFPGESVTFKVNVTRKFVDIITFTEYKYLWIDVTRDDISAEDLMNGELEAITKLGSKVLGTSNTLTLENVGPEDNGRRFVCVAFNGKAKGFTFGISPEATLTVLPMTDCTHSVLKPIKGVEPTCTEAGNVPYYKCNVCGNIFADSNAETVTTPELVTIPATGHKTVGGMRVEPTCTKAGHTEGGTCVYCGLVVEEQLILAPTGHTPTEISAAVAPTCGDAGISAKVICQTCGEVLQDAEELPALGHDFHGAKCSVCGVYRQNPFVDVSASDYYFEPVMWAVYSEPQVTQGTDAYHFSPSDACTRGQVVTFLWRAAGSPEPVLRVCPFIDVTPENYFYKAVLWAYERGIAMGITNTEFAPYRNVTRAQFVTFLWRYKGEPAPKSIVSPFTDVQDTSSPFYMSILWAAENDITSGRTATSFAPNDVCTRGNVVTFIYRGFNLQK